MRHGAHDTFHLFNTHDGKDAREEVGMAELASFETRNLCPNLIAWPIFAFSESLVSSQRCS